jgi:RNA polymerase sigma-70 factor (ECF subfamily)
MHLPVVLKTKAGNRIVAGVQQKSETEKSETVAGHFRTTHWSVVLAAGQLSAPDAAQALEKLCAAYWYPLYTWLRCRSHSVHDAQDLTQAFLVHLLDKDRLQKPDPAKGKFRSFLLASLKNFLTNEWDKTQALKRGAQFTFISVDEERGESRFRVEPSHDATPDKAFEQSWAMTLLELVLDQLKQEYARAEKSGLFDALQEYLSGDKSAVPYVEMAARLNLSEAALKMSVLRLRRRFGELLRAEIAHTVTRPEEIDEEIRALFAAVR